MTTLLILDSNGTYVFGLKCLCGVSHLKNEMAFLLLLQLNGIKLSSGFGFLCFAKLTHAKDFDISTFLHRNHSVILIHPRRCFE